MAAIVCPNHHVRSEVNMYLLEACCSSCTQFFTINIRHRINICLGKDSAIATEPGIATSPLDSVSFWKNYHVTFITFTCALIHFSILFDIFYAMRFASQIGRGMKKLRYECINILWHFNKQAKSNCNVMYKVGATFCIQIYVLENYGVCS